MKRNDGIILFNLKYFYLWLVSIVSFMVMPPLASAHQTSILNDDLSINMPDIKYSGMSMMIALELELYDNQIDPDNLYWRLKSLSPSGNTNNHPFLNVYGEYDLNPTGMTNYSCTDGDRGSFWDDIPWNVKIIQDAGKLILHSTMGGHETAPNIDFEKYGVTSGNGNLLKNGGFIVNTVGVVKNEGTFSHLPHNEQLLSTLEFNGYFTANGWQGSLEMTIYSQADDVRCFFNTPFIGSKQ